MIETALILAALVNRLVELIKALLTQFDIPDDARRPLLLLAQVVVGVALAFAADVNLISGLGLPDGIGVLASGAAIAVGAEGVHVLVDLVERLAPDDDDGEPMG